MVTLFLHSPGEGGFLQTAIHTVIGPSCCGSQAPDGGPDIWAPGLQAPGPCPEGLYLLSSHRCRDSLHTAGTWGKDFGTRDNMGHKAQLKALLAV